MTETPLGFLEAHRLAAGEAVGPPEAVRLVMSGTVDVLSMYLVAEGRRLGRELDIQPLPFNTLQQWLRAPLEQEDPEEWVVLFPWDLAPVLDWRSGVPRGDWSLATLEEDARRTADWIRKRGIRNLWYVPAPVPPCLRGPGADVGLSWVLGGVAANLGANVLRTDAFDLGSYLASGSPFRPAATGRVAKELVGALRGPEPAKVLVTDLDNVMWDGVIGEDGLDGIACGPEGAGYRHFVYQGLLARLKEAGILVCAVSRNDQDLAEAPFREGKTQLALADLLTVVGSYEAKSAQIRSIAERLNLGLDACVFVDDNPVELAEVGEALPQVRRLAFPDNEAGFPAFLDELWGHFATGATLTAEDRRRTEMYRSRMEGLEASTRDGADLDTFLGSLEMTLTLHDRGQGDRARAVQLINKTNQFNLNGRRLTDEEVGAILDRGGALYSASLSDRTGDHGEITALLLDERGTAVSWVMSCRVFQRRVEHVFLMEVLRRHPFGRLQFAETERNRPIQAFLEELDGTASAEGWAFDGEGFAARHRGLADLFEVTSWG